MIILSGNSLIETYNKIFETNYERLKIVVAHGDEDLLHHIYIKNLNRFKSNEVFTATTAIERHLLNYISLSLHNENKTWKKNEKNYVEINHEAENVLKCNEKYQEDEIKYDNEIRFITEKLFNYVRKNYNEAEFYVFRVYYLFDESGKKITYKKLSKITGYSISKVCGIIQKIKKDLNSNLLNYINNESDNLRRG